MDKKNILAFQENKTTVRINLKNGYFFTGIIVSIDESSIMFKDKFGKDMPIDLDSISYVIPVG